MKYSKAKSEKEIFIDEKKYKMVSLKDYKVDHLPFSIRVLLENALRNFDGFSVTEDHIQTLLNWMPQTEDKDIPFHPARVLMQLFCCVLGVFYILCI